MRTTKASGSAMTTESTVRDRATRNSTSAYVLVDDDDETAAIGDDEEVDGDGDGDDDEEVRLLAGLEEVEGGTLTEIGDGDFGDSSGTDWFLRNVLTETDRQNATVRRDCVACCLACLGFLRNLGEGRLEESPRSLALVTFR